MNEKPQSYANHVRRQPAFHFFLTPILILNFLFVAVYAIRHPSLVSGWAVILSVALLILAFLSRMGAVTVQDRLIRLEERIRLAALLAEPLRNRIPELSVRQLTALRFVSDEEIPGLVEETLRENLGAKDIKKKIQKWRPDFLRV